MSQEKFIEKDSEDALSSPGSFMEFREQLAAQGEELTDGESLELYNDALVAYRAHLAEESGLSLEDLHHSSV